MVNYLTTIFTFLIFFSVAPIKGLDRDHWGTHFVFSFLAYNDTDIKDEIIITTREHVNVSVIFHETNTEYYFELAGETSQTIANADNTTVGSIHQVLPKKAVSVEASRNVSVYGLSRSKNYADSFLVLPTMGLDNEYITVNCNSTRYSQIVIVAVEDSTNVTVNLKPWQYTYCQMNQTLNYSDITFVLASYDVFHIYCKIDLTGSVITSTKPVAVITGCACDKSAPCDHMIEMIPPISNFGKHHIIVPPGELDVIFRIVNFNSTLITIKNKYYIQQTRAFLDLQVNESAEITSNQSVLVVMYMVGTSRSVIHLSYGRFMMIVPPSNRYTTQYIFYTSVYTPYKNFIIISNSSSNSQFSLQNDIVGTYYKYGLGLEDDNLIYTDNSPFCLLVYSIKELTGIGCPGGMKITDYSGENECHFNPCLNSGWCLEVGESFFCRCTQHFTGTYCDEEVPTSTVILNTTVITTYTTANTNNDNPNITTEYTSLNTTVMTRPTTTEMTTPTTTDTNSFNTTEMNNTTEMTTPTTTDMISLNTTEMTNTPEITTPTTTSMILFNTTEMNNTKEMTTPTTTDMISLNTTEMTNTPEITTPTTTDMTSSNTTEMTTLNTVEMNNTTEMTTPTTTGMISLNTTELTNTPEITTPTTTDMTSSNTTEMTTFNTAEMTNITEITTNTNKDITSFNNTEINTVNTAEMNYTTSTEMTTPTTTDMTTLITPNTTTMEMTTSDMTSPITAEMTPFNTAELTIDDTTTHVTNYTTTEDTDKYHPNESTSPCWNEADSELDLINIYLKCNDTLYWCNCPCPPNESYASMLGRLNSQYQRLLLLDAELLGKTIRKKTSAINYRESHTYLGVSSVGITLIFLSSVVLLDLTNLLKWCCERFKGNRVRFVRKRRPF